MDRNDSLDFSTILDIELCNQFLKSGIQILVPPDLEDPTFENNADVVNNYHQWSLILQEIFPIIIYSLNENEYIKFSKKKSIPILQNAKIKNVLNNTSVLAKKNLTHKSTFNGHRNSNSTFYIDCESGSDNNESQNAENDGNPNNNCATSNSHDVSLFNEEVSLLHLNFNLMKQINYNTYTFCYRIFCICVKYVNIIQMHPHCFYYFLIQLGNLLIHLKYLVLQKLPIIQIILQNLNLPVLVINTKQNLVMKLTMTMILIFFMKNEKYFSIH